MKKIKLFILLLILSIPMFVSADASGAMITEYKIRISNKSGAIVYEWDNKNEKYIKTNEVLKYDNTYTVMFEQINNKQLYGSIYETIGEGDDAEFKSYTINLADAKPLKYNLEDYKQDSTQKYYVFEEGVTLYQGPSKIYDKVSPEKSISVDTTLETKYYDELWAYIEYQGTKGWIYTDSTGSIYDETAGVAELNNGIVSLKTIGPVELYETPKSDKTIGVTIPKNTELNNYKFSAIYSIRKGIANWYIEYNGKKGWLRMDIKNSNVAEMNDFPESFAVANYQGIKLYNNPNDEKNIIDTIPYLTELSPAIYIYWKDYRDYDNNHWLQVTYDNKIGWIKEENYNSKNISFAYFEEEKIIKINNLEGLILYEDLNNNKSQVTIVPYKYRISTNLYVNTEGGTWYYTEYDGQEGWVFISYEEENDDDSNNNQSSNQSHNSSSDSYISKDSKSSITEKVLTYTCIVVVVCLTTTVTVILINKKKKDNNASK